MDVGQADSHAIITEDGTIDLIDADKEAVADELDTIIDGRTLSETETGHIPIETFVLTHIHDDHSRGIRALRKNGYEIQNVVEPAEYRYEVRDSDQKSKKGVKRPVLVVTRSV